MTKSQNTLTSPVSITVEASTDNQNDKGYHHCFEQDNTRILTFEVDTDLSVDNIYFVLWNIHDPVKNPHIAEPPKDWAVKNGHVTIKIGPDHPVHLGPGPYCATLTASSPSASSDTSNSARKIVGNALYYYETWKGSRDCKYEK